MGFEIKDFKDPESLARQAARDWLENLAVENSATAPYGVALSGGRIAGRLFSAVTELAGERRALLGAVHFFWGDERCVPPTDPESNFALARQRLLDPLAIPPSQIHRIHGEEPPAAAVAEAESELSRVMVSRQGSLPILDLVFLGMGEDGHVASLFPGEPEAAASAPALFRPVIGPKPPPRRITLGYSVIAAAREVWVLASGSGKEEALQKSLAPNGATPLARVLQMRPHTVIFSDLARG